MSIQLKHVEFSGQFFRHLYLCNYRPAYRGSDELSTSLLRFKTKSAIDLAAWTECCLLELSKVTFREDLLIVRALSSNEIALQPADCDTALDHLGELLAEKLDAVYQPQALIKKKAIPAVKLLSKTEREVELENTYLFDSATHFQEVLLIDDILTTGSTAREIIRATRQVYHDIPISVFTLADTDHVAMINQDISLKGYNYRWDNAWDEVAEREYNQIQLKQLKDKIMSDQF